MLYLGSLLAFTAWLASCLGPVEILLGLGQNVQGVPALQALFVLAIHVPVDVQVALASGTGSE